MTYNIIIHFSCRTVIQYFYALQNDQHSKSSYHLCSYKLITVLLTIFPMPYIASLWLIYFITRSFCLLVSSTYFTNSSISLPSGNPSLFSDSMSLFTFCCGSFLESTCQWKHIVCVFLWLISFRMMPSRSIMLFKMARFHSSLWMNNISLYIYIS